jgi:hypothetical protein
MISKAYFLPFRKENRLRKLQQQKTLLYKWKHACCLFRQHSLVAIVMDYGVCLLVQKTNVSAQHHDELSSSCSIGTWALSLGIKQLGHEADHSPPSSVDIKMCVMITLFQHRSSWRDAKIIRHTHIPYLVCHMGIQVLELNSKKEKTAIQNYLFTYL